MRLREKNNKREKKPRGGKKKRIAYGNKRRIKKGTNGKMGDKKDKKV